MKYLYYSIENIGQIVKSPFLKYRFIYMFFHFSRADYLVKYLAIFWVKK